MKRLLLFTPLLIACTSGFAQLTPIPLDTATATRNMDASQLTIFDNALYFVAQDQTHGRELWKYTGAGVPTLAYDLNANTAAGVYKQNYEHLAVVGSALYFAGDDGSTGFELYKYTGSGAPTITNEINVGTAYLSEVKNVFALGGKVYFSARTAAAGAELYQYDPATNATTLYELRPGTNSGDPQSFVAMNGILYFNGTVNQGTELIKFDPSTNTLSVAANIAAGNSGSDPQNLTVIGNRIYFTAYTDTVGREFWYYDGTAAGRITNLDNGASSSLNFTSDNVIKFAEYAGHVYFAGNDGAFVHSLYKYNEATGAVTLVHTIGMNAIAPAYGMVAYDGKLYFSADDGTHGSEIWVHDGTNTSMLTDLSPNINGCNFSDPLVWNNTLYFNANSGTGSTLYKLGTVTGIQKVSLDGSISVYPNPATDNWHFAFDLKTGVSLSVKISDISGRVVYSSGLQHANAGASRIFVPAASLVPGQYFYQIVASDNQLLAAGSVVKQ